MRQDVAKTWKKKKKIQNGLSVDRHEGEEEKANERRKKIQNSLSVDRQEGGGEDDGGLKTNDGEKKNKRRFKTSLSVDRDKRGRRKLREDKERRSQYEIAAMIYEKKL